MCGAAFEAEPGVVLRMSDDDNERTAALAQNVQTAANQVRANALALPIRQDGQRGQPHPDNPADAALDRHRREEDVTHDAAVVRHQ